MKITDVRTILLTGPNTNDPFLSESRKRRSAAYIEIHTDSELIGLGETYAGYFFPEGVPAAVEFFKPILVGQDLDVTPIAELWQRMYHCANFWARVGFGVIVINGLEAALWDLRGKMLGVPVYELLGGAKHESLPAYATGGPSNFPYDKLARKVDFYQSLGFRGFKVGAGSLEVKADGSVTGYIPMRPSEAADFEGAKVRYLREHVGRDVNIMLDGHMGNNDETWDLGIAQAVMKAVEPYDLFFFEEPLHYTDPWGYAELARSTSVPIAGGECLTAAYEWRVFVDRDSFDIGQPDAAFTGGILESLRVASMLEARGRRIATHSWASGGGFMQNLHFGFAAGNTCMLEIAPAFGPLHSEVVGDSFRMTDGRVLPPAGPGLGIRLTEETKAKFPFRGGGEYNSVPGKILDD